VQQLINTIATIIAAMAGGIMTSKTSGLGSWRKRLPVIAVGMLSGYFVGYPFGLFLLNEFKFLDNWAAFGLAGFTAAAIIPVIYGLFVAITEAIKTNPQSWVELISNLIGNVKGKFTNSPRVKTPVRDKKPTIVLEPPPE
jgi:hypothetical protein